MYMAWSNNFQIDFFPIDNCIYLKFYAVSFEVIPSFLDAVKPVIVPLLDSRVEVLFWTVQV
jgi:hypothetical protein